MPTQGFKPGCFSQAGIDLGNCQPLCNPGLLLQALPIQRIHGKYPKGDIDRERHDGKIFMRKVKKVEDILDFTWCLQRITTQTLPGSDYKKTIKPYPRRTGEYLEKTLDQVEACVSYLASLDSTMRLDGVLGLCKDVRLSIRRPTERNALSEVELFKIKAFVFLLDDLKAYLESNKVPSFKETEIQPI